MVFTVETESIVGSTGSQGNNAYQSLATYNYSEKNYENKLGPI